MLDNLLRNEFLLISILVFTAVLLLLESAYLIWRGRHGPEARNMRRRLDAIASPRDVPGNRTVTRKAIDENLNRMGRALQRTPAFGQLGQWIQQADLQWSVPGLLVACAVAGLLGWSIAVSLLGLPGTLTVFVTALTAYLPLAYVQWRRARRLAAIERQLPDALDLITRAVRAGHAFTSALKMAGDEMPDPIGMELRAINDEVTYGISLQQALSHLSDRIPLTDIRFFVVAVLIQRESGGNLTEILSNLSRLVRERHKLLARVRVLSAEGRMSGWILGVMPFALGGMLYLINPKFMAPLWNDPIGITIMKYTLGMMMAGALILMRIVRIRV